MFAGQTAESELFPHFCTVPCTDKPRAPRDVTQCAALPITLDRVQFCTAFPTEAVSGSLTKMFSCLEERRRLKKGCCFQPGTEMMKCL